MSDEISCWYRSLPCVLPLHWSFSVQMWLTGSEKALSSVGYQTTTFRRVLGGPSALRVNRRLERGAMVRRTSFLFFASSDFVLPWVENRDDVSWRLVARHEASRIVRFSRWKSNVLHYHHSNQISLDRRMLTLHLIITTNSFLCRRPWLHVFPRMRLYPLRLRSFWNFENKNRASSSPGGSRWDGDLRS
jgi:hypothetical protein